MSDGFTALADRIPEMGGRAIGPWLREWAALCRTGAIVEVGCWLGAGTAQLAIGARVSGAEIHVYDRWQARRSEVRKAYELAGIRLTPGEDTLPRVRETLAPFDVPIHFHQGLIQRATWHGAPIGLYVDDASKQAATFAYMRAAFWPCLVEGAVLVLMDYHFHEKAGPRYLAQRQFMEAHTERYTMVGDHLGGTSAAAFVSSRPQG